MKYFEDYKNFSNDVTDAVVVIGNFDGVHRGHQTLIARGRDIADAMDKPLAVLTFEPHPRQLFRPDEPPCRITPLDVKLECLEKQHVDVVFSLPFNWEFASQSAESFAQDILIDGLQANHIVIGQDFHFGQLRKGNADTLRDAGLAVTSVDSVIGKDGLIYSSSAVRQHLRHGDIEKANDILGWNWEIEGMVIRGDQRGRELGYPTANMKLNQTIHPAYGIYAVLAQIKGEEEWLMGAANIGIRPMFEVEIAQVETYIFDFDEEIYEKTLRVRPVQRLRSEAKFNSLDDLVVQMEKDCQQARDILEKYV